MRISRTHNYIHHGISPETLYSGTKRDKKDHIFCFFFFFYLGHDVQQYKKGLRNMKESTGDPTLQLRAEPTMKRRDYHPSTH